MRGVVQGVGFRWFVRRHADRLALAGWVANEPDGSVRVVAEGPSERLDELEEALRRGPSAAHVVGLDSRREAARGGLDGFRVRAGGHSGD